MNSIWEFDCEIEERSSLNEDLSVSTLVIGAGMAGILTAYKLYNEGEDVVVIDSGRIGGGQTKNTTAKITAQHDDIYGRLIRTFGEEQAREYATENLRAVLEYSRIIKEENIDCDFKILPSYIYSCDNREKIEKEYAVVKALGMDSVLEDKIELPVHNALALKLENQAQFSPMKFIKAISRDLTVYEKTRVLSIDRYNVVKTTGGYIFAKNIVFACHYPFVNFPGLFFARMHQERSYVLALKNAVELNGMYKSLDENGFSFRTYKDNLLMGGIGHRSGKYGSENRYMLLKEKANALFPNCREVCRWSAQDCITADGVPYIGHYPMTKRNWYVATGFGKWGMSTSMVAADLISSLILQKREKYSGVFSPSKFRIHTIPKIITDGLTSVKNLCREKLTYPAKCINEIPIGSAGIVSYKEQKLGIYRKSEHEMYFVTVKCPHLGCQLSWNESELSWDCPCHGSRFDYTGKIICGPAQSDISAEIS